MKEKILITGGTGLIGSRLTEILLQNGYDVNYFSRSSTKTDVLAGVQVYTWDIEKNYLDLAALEGVVGIVHLAGSNIGDTPWSEPKRKEILESRTKSSALLIQTLKTQAHQVRVFVSASAIGYYGLDTGSEIVDENSKSGDGFPAQVTRVWEQAVVPVSELMIRLVRLRIGIVLSCKSGALPKLLAPIRLGVGAALGSGKQYMSWIHIDDMAAIILKSIQDERMSGVYNAVAPEPVTNATLTKTAAKLLSRPLWLPNIPGFILKMIVGEMADVVVGGNRVSSQKIQSGGYMFKFKTILAALEDLLKAGK